MEVVGARFRHRVQYGTRIPAVFRIDGVGNQVELCNGVRAGNNQRSIERKVVRVHAVHKEAVLVGLATVGREIAAPVGGGYHPRQSLLELNPVPPVQGNINNLAPRNRGPKLDAGFFDLGWGSLDRHFLSDLAELHLHVLHVNLGDRQPDVPGLVGFEAALLALEVIARGGGKLNEFVAAIRRCGGCTRNSSTSISDGNGGARDHRARRVGYHASDSGIDVNRFCRSGSH